MSLCLLDELLLNNYFLQLLLCLLFKINQTLSSIYNPNLQMKFTFVSFAALSLSASQAARLQKQVTSEHLVQEKPQSYSNIMESVKSLEKAFEYHKNEEKLLNEINNELKEYQTIQEQARSDTSDEPFLVATKVKESTKSKAKAEHKEKEKV